MSTSYYIQVIFKNLLIAIVAFLLIDFVVEGIFRQNVQYNPVFEYSIVFGALVGLAAGFNEVLVERSIRQLSADSILLKKVNLLLSYTHYARIFRVFVMSSVLCLLLIMIITPENDPLQAFIQLSAIPVCLALGTNVPQTYTARLTLNNNRHEALNVIQQTLYDSVFEVTFKDHYHIVYNIENRWRRLYTFFFAPDRCTLEVAVYKDYVEITGSYRYLHAFLRDPYINILTRKKEDQAAGNS